MSCDECLLFGSTMSIDIKYVGMIYNRACLLFYNNFLTQVSYNCVMKNYLYQEPLSNIIIYVILI